MVPLNQFWENICHRFEFATENFPENVKLFLSGDRILGNKSTKGARDHYTCEKTSHVETGTGPYYAVIVT